MLLNFLYELEFFFFVVMMLSPAVLPWLEVDPIRWTGWQQI